MKVSRDTLLYSVLVAFLAAMTLAMAFLEK